MNQTTFKNIVKNETARFQSNQMSENMNFLAGLRDMDIKDNTTKMAEAYIESMKNRTLYKNAYDNIRTRTYSELGIDPTFGQSKYDAAAENLYQMRNLNDFRASQQGRLAKLGSGLVGAVANTLTTTATPFMIIPNGIFGIVNAATDDNPNNNGWQSFWNGVLNNKVMTAFSTFNDWVSEVAPIYRSEEEQNMNPFGKMFTTGFWAEDFIKNLGFTVGAMVGGKLLGRTTQSINNKVLSKFHRLSSDVIAEKLSRGEDLTDLLTNVSSKGTMDEKLVTLLNEAGKYQRASTQLSTAVGLISGATTEARIEALQTRNQMVEAGLLELRNVYNYESDIAHTEYINAKQNGDISPETTFEQFVDTKLEQGTKELEYRANEVARHTFLFESALLTFTNAALWRDWYDVGFRNGKNKVDSKLTGVNINKDNPLASTVKKNKLKHITRYLEYFVTEGGEEMAQSAITSGLENYYGSKLNDDYRELKLAANPKYAESVLSVGEAIFSGLQTAFNNQGLTEGLVGGITGIIGLPSAKYSKAQRKAKNISVFNPKAYRMEGGLWAAYRKNKEESNKAKEFVANLQKTFQKGEKTGDIIDSLAGLIAAQHRELGADIANNKQEKYDARRDQFLKLIDVYDRLGIIDKLVKDIDLRMDLNKLSENERNLILQRAYDSQKTKETDVASEEELKELQTKIEQWARHEKKLLTTYRDLEDKLVEIANFTSTNNVEEAVKRMLIDQIKHNTVKLSDLSERVASLYNKLSSMAIPDNLLNISSLENSFPDLKYLLDAPLQTNLNNEVETYDEVRDRVIPLIRKSLNDNAQMDYALSQRSKDKALEALNSGQSSFDILKELDKISRDIVDYYVLSQRVKLTSKAVSKPLATLLKQSKELLKDIESETKKNDNAQVTALTSKISDFFDQIKGQGYDDASTNMYFQTFKSMVQDLMSYDDDAYTEFIKEAKAIDPTTQKWVKPRLGFFANQLIYDQNKQIAIEKDLDLRQIPTIKDELSSTMPYLIHSKINEILGRTDLTQAEKDIVENWQRKVQDDPWYKKRGSESAKVVEVPVTKPQASTETTPSTNPATTPEVMQINTIPDNVMLGNSLTTTLIGYINKYTSLVKNSDLQLNTSKLSEGIISVTALYKNDEEARNVPDNWTGNIEYTLNLKSNLLLIDIKTKDGQSSMLQSPISIKFTDFIQLWNNTTYSKYLGGFLFNITPYDDYIHNNTNNVADDVFYDIYNVINAPLQHDIDNSDLTSVEKMGGVKDYIKLTLLSSTNKSRNNIMLYRGLPLSKNQSGLENIFEEVDNIVNGIVSLYTTQATTNQKSASKTTNITERTYSEQERTNLAEINRQFKNPSDGETNLITLVRLLNLQLGATDPDSFIKALQDNGYDVTLTDQGQIDSIIFLNSAFPTSESLNNAKGVFPVGYEITYKGQTFQVDKTENGKIVSGIFNSGDVVKTLQRNDKGVWYITNQQKEAEENEKQSSTHQRSTIHLTEYITKITSASGKKEVNTFPITPKSINAKTYEKHAGFYDYLEPQFKEIYQNVNTGLIQPNDQVYFERVIIPQEDLQRLQQNDSTLNEWLHNVNYYIVAKNQNGIMLGIITPTTQIGQNSELYDKVIKSGLRNDTFNYVDQVQYVDNSYERVIKLQNNKMQSLNKIADTYDELKFVLRTGGQTHTNDVNNETWFNQEQTVNRMYGNDTSSGQWTMQEGRLYIIPRNSSGGVIPQYSTAPNLSVGVHVKATEDALQQVLDEFFEIEPADPDLQAKLYKLFNNAFFIAPNYKILVNVNNNQLTLNIGEDDGDGHFVSITQLNLENGLKIVSTSKTFNIDMDTSEIAQWLANNQARISYTKHSFNTQNTNLLTYAGVNLRWLFEHNLLESAAVHNRTSNAHPVLTGNGSVTTTVQSQPETASAQIQQNWQQQQQDAEKLQQGTGEVRKGIDTTDDNIEQQVDNRINEILSDQFDITDEVGQMDFKAKLKANKNIYDTSYSTQTDLLHTLHSILNTKNKKLFERFLSCN